VWGVFRVGRCCFGGGLFGGRRDVEGVVERFGGFGEGGIVGEDIGQGPAGAAVEVGRAELSAVEEAEHELVDHRAELFEQIEHERGSAVFGLMKEAELGVEPAAEDFGFDDGAEDGVAEGEAGVDGVFRRASGAAFETKEFVAEQFIELAEVFGGGLAFEAADDVEIEGGFDSLVQEAHLPEGEGQGFVLETALGAEEDFALVFDFCGDDCSGDGEAEMGIDCALILDKTERGVFRGSADQTAAEAAAGGEEDAVDAVFEDEGDGAGGEFDLSEEEQLVELGGANAVDDGFVALDDQEVAIGMEYGALFGEG